MRIAAGPTDVPLPTLLREDLRRHAGNWSRPGFQALAVHRIGGRLALRRLRGGAMRPLWTGLLALVRLLQVFIRNVYGIEIHHGTHVGRRLLIAHQHGISVHHFATIGDDCVLHQGVTIGRGTPGRRVAPRIGNRVEIGPGAVVMGAIQIGDDVIISPNALVMTNVPAGARVVTPPARVVQLSAPAGGGRP